MKKIVVLILFALALFSCTDEFITKDPLGVSSDATFYNDADNCRLAVNAMYDPLGHQQLYARNYMAFDMMSDDAEKGGDMANYDSDQPDIHLMMLYKSNSLNPQIAGFWKKYYTIITRANAMLEKAPESDPEIKKMRAEARFLRSFAHFELVRIFGPVPLVDKTIAPDDAKNAGNRTGASDANGSEQIQLIYDFIITELEAIKNDLPASYPVDERGKVTSIAVKAYLAKAYLYAGDYAKSYEVSKDLIASAPSKLDVYHNIFNLDGDESSSEVIFSIQMIPSAGYDVAGDGSIKTLDMGPRAFEKNGVVNSGTSTFGYGLNIPTQTLVNSFTPGDPRLDLIAKANIDTLYLPIFSDTPEWTKIGKHPKNTGNYSLKPYLNYDVRSDGGASPQSLGKDIILMRWAEVYLNGAEAAYRNGNTTDAKDWVNAVRTRARESKRTKNATTMVECEYATGTVPANLPTVTITDIKKERQNELFMENGTRYFDLVRWNLTNDGDGISADEICANLKFDLVGKPRVWNPASLGRLPIPMTELILHSGGNLKQNPSY